MYIAVNKTNLTYNIIHEVTIYQTGNMTVRSPPNRVFDSCVQHIVPTQYFLIYSCPTFLGYHDREEIPEQGKIFISLRSSFETVFEIAGAGKGSRFGGDLQVIESNDGLQLQIFSLKHQPKYSMSVV